LDETSMSLSLASDGVPRVGQDTRFPPRWQAFLDVADGPRRSTPGITRTPRRLPPPMRVSNVRPRFVAAGRSIFASAPRRSASSRRISANDPRSFVNDPRSFVNDPRSFVNDPWSSANDPRSSANDPRSSVNDPRSFANDPRSSVSDPRSSVDDPRSLGRGGEVWPDARSGLLSSPGPARRRACCAGGRWA